MPGKLVVAQTRDFAHVRAVLERNGLSAGRIEVWGCWLVAWWGDEPVGAIALETVVDTAVIGLPAVVPEWRRRGFGTALLNAARTAASTRGARQIYAFVPRQAADYLKRFGFVEAAPADFARAAEGIAAGRLPLAGDGCVCTPLLLDIAHDGEIAR